MKYWSLYSFLLVISFVFQFYLGTIITSVVPAVVLLFALIFSCRKLDCWIVSFVLVFLFLLVSSGVVAGVRGVNVDVYMVRVLEYLRGVFIASAFYILVRDDMEGALRGAVVACYCGIICSMVVLFLWLVNKDVFYLVTPSFDRAYTGFIGLYHNPNYWSIACAVMGFILVAATRLYGIIRPGVYFATLICLVLLIVATGSRMGFMLAALLVICSVRLRSLSFRRVAPVLVFSSVLFFIYLYYGTSVEVDLTAWERMLERGNRLLNNIEEEDRFYRLMWFFEQFEVSPEAYIFGFGLNNFMGMPTPHNTFVTSFIEFGWVVTLFVFVVSMVSAVLVSFRNSKVGRLGGLAFLMLLLISLSNDLQDTRAAWLLVGFYLYSLQCFFANRKSGGVVPY